MKTELLFGVVAVFVVVFAAAVFGMQYVVPETNAKAAIVQTIETVPTVTYTTTEIVEYDAEREMEYVYVQSQNINGNPEELGEILQHLYGIAEDYEPVEYDMLQEQVDNERTIAKYVRDFIEPLS